MKKEALTTKVYISKVGELHIGFKIKAGDFDMTEAANLMLKWQDGVPQQINIEDFQPESMAGEHTYPISTNNELSSSDNQGNGEFPNN